MSKDLKYIIKRVLIGVLIGVILFNLKSCNVNAITNTDVFNSFIIPDNMSAGRFYTCNGNNNCQNRGYSLLNYNGIYYALPSQSDYTYGTYGGVLSLCNMSFITDNYYSVTYVFVSSDYDYVFPNYSALSPKVGIGGVVGSNLSFNYSAITRAQQIGDIPGLLPIGGYIYTFTIIFKAPSIDTCLNIAISSSSKSLTSGELAFVGFKYENVGNQPLTESQIQNIINSSNQTIINNISQSTQSIINNQNSNTQQIIVEQQNTSDAVNDVNDTMKNDNVDSPNTAINSVKNGIANNGVITQLITLPVTLFQQILNSIGGTCQSFDLGELFGTNLILPCIDVSNYLGSTLWGIIDVIISGYFVWVIARKMISAFEMFSAMKDGDVLDD